MVAHVRDTRRRNIRTDILKTLVNFNLRVPVGPHAVAEISIAQCYPNVPDERPPSDIDRIQSETHRGYGGI